MSRGLPWVWGATPAEVSASYPCADIEVPARVSAWRAVSVAAPVGVTWAWVCQLKRAPYSYDLLDNLGRRSPRRLDPGQVPIAVGDEVVMIFEAVHVGESEWTGQATPKAERFIGQLATTYRVSEHRSVSGESIGSRLVCRLDFGSKRPGGPVAHALAAGDLVMMRKQLLTLKKLAERDATTGSVR